MEDTCPTCGNAKVNDEFYRIKKDHDRAVRERDTDLGYRGTIESLKMESNVFGDNLKEEQRKENPHMTPIKENKLRLDEDKDTLNSSVRDLKN